MKRLLLSLILLSAVGLSAQVSNCTSTSYGNSVTCVQAAVKIITSGTSTTLAYGSNPTANHLLIAWLSSDCPLSASSCNTEAATISDTIGNTWNTCPARLVGSGTQGSVYCWYAVNNSTAADTITYASLLAPGSASHLMLQTEWSGMATSSVLDQTGTATAANQTTVSTSSATTNGTDLVCGHFMDWTNNDTLTVGSGYTIVGHNQDTTNGSADMTECKTVTTTGTQTATCGGNTSGDILVDTIQAFKTPVGGGAPTAMPVVY